MKEEIKTTKTKSKNTKPKTSSAKKKTTTKTNTAKTTKTTPKSSTAAKRQTTAKVSVPKKEKSDIEVKTTNSKKTDDNVKSSNKTNNTNETLRMIIVGAILLVLVGITFIIGITRNINKSRYQKHTGINQISVSEYMKIINEQDTSLIYIARPTCSYCQMFEPVLTSVLEKYKIGVEYIDISAISAQEECDKFYNSNEFLSSGEWGTPTLLIYKDKKILDINSGYVEEEDLVKFLKENKLIGD